MIISFAVGFYNGRLLNAIDEYGYNITSKITGGEK
jgi:hypothetical protein